MFHPDCLKTVFFGLFYLTWMFEVFRSLRLNLPMNPKCGKTWARQLPIMKHFSVVCFSLERGLSVFQTRHRHLSASVCGFEPPLVYWDICTHKQSSIKCFVYPRTQQTSKNVSCEQKYCADVFFMSTIDLECECEREYSSCLGGEMNPPFILCKSVYRFLLYTLSESFSAGLMYWLLCNSWTKHRLELIFKEKRLYSIFVL